MKLFLLPEEKAPLRGRFFLSTFCALKCNPLTPLRGFVPILRCATGKKVEGSTNPPDTPLARPLLALAMRAVQRRAYRKNGYMKPLGYGRLYVSSGLGRKRAKKPDCVSWTRTQHLSDNTQNGLASRFRDRFVP